MDPSSAPLAPPLAGDFFALLTRQQPGPASRASSASAPAPPASSLALEATTVFAFHFADGVLVAGDRRATAGNVIVTDQIEKVIPLDATSILAIAGSPAMAFEMARTLQTSFEYYRRSQLQPLSLPARVRALSRALRENLALTLQGVGVVAPLFAGLDTSTVPAQPRIFFYDPLGAQFLAVNYAASGSGSTTIRSILSFQERFGSPPPAALSRRDAVRFALRLLMVAAEFDSATGGVAPEFSRFATLRVLNADGVHLVTDDEQKASLA